MEKKRSQGKKKLVSPKPLSPPKQIKSTHKQIPITLVPASSRPCGPFNRSPLKGPEIDPLARLISDQEHDHRTFTLHRDHESAERRAKEGHERTARPKKVSATSSPGTEKRQPTFKTFKHVTSVAPPQLPTPPLSPLSPAAASTPVPSHPPLQVAEDKEEEEKTGLRFGLLFWIYLAMMILMVGYAWLSIDRIRMARYLTRQENLEQVIEVFPKNPYEYNERQRLAHTTNLWRRFNFRNLSLLCGSCITSLLLAWWHRRRQVMLMRRKTLFFWFWTCGAGMVSILWGSYIFRVAYQQPLLSGIYRDRRARALLYLGLILLLALMLYAYRLRNRATKSQKMLKAWRKKKHEQMMKKQSDLPYTPPEQVAVPQKHLTDQ